MKMNNLSAVRHNDLALHHLTKLSLLMYLKGKRRKRCSLKFNDKMSLVSVPLTLVSPLSSTHVPEDVESLFRTSFLNF